MVIKALDPDWFRTRIGIQHKMLDPDPDEMNADPQPCSSTLELQKIGLSIKVKWRREKGSACIEKMQRTERLRENQEGRNSKREGRVRSAALAGW